MSASGESSTMMHRIGSGSHPIPTPYDPNLVIPLIPVWDRFIHVPRSPLEACQEPLNVRATSGTSDHSPPSFSLGPHTQFHHLAPNGDVNRRQSAEKGYNE
ncbi:separase [Dorcoceras hygrometricum]|uniref:Separase n=1 Tax=Dorcoceras hygrometricum TaxID=472368 RepID=A0A2Z7D4I6_9LAMI|nr:separase [Dorcoceras hygrometricum]